MPIIERIETDMFRFSNVCRHMVCPVPTEYHINGGLIVPFIERDPAIKDLYKTLCEEDKLVIGKPQCHRTSKSLIWDTIFFPMKKYAEDTAKYKDVRKNIEDLRRWLMTPVHKNTVIGMPMLGCEGGGPDPYKRVKEMMYLYLDPLPAITFLSQSPSKVDHVPKYLVILGPKGLAKTSVEKERIGNGVSAVLKKWGMELSDFDAVLSGNETTTDKFIAGSPGDLDHSKTYAGQHHAKKVIAVPINWDEDKTLALTRHRMVLAEIGTHFIFIMPENVNNNRCIYMNAYVREANQKLASLNREEKIVAILGKATTNLIDEDPLNIE